MSYKYLESMAAVHEHETDPRVLAERLIHGQRHGMNPESMVAGALADGADPEVMALALSMVPTPGSLAARLAERKASGVAERQRVGYIAALRLRAEAAEADLEIEQAEAAESGRGTGSGSQIPAIRRKAEAARSAYLAALSGGPVADTEDMRSRRRAALHAARKREPLAPGQVEALARQLADGCETFRWSGALTPHVRLPRQIGLTTGVAWTHGERHGTDTRTGIIGHGTGRSGEKMSGVHHGPLAPESGGPTPGVTLPDGRPMGADLTHVQNGVVLVDNGTVLADRDDSHDLAAEAARRVARDAERVVVMETREPRREYGLALRAEADALLDIAAEAEREAAARERKQARSGAPGAAEYRPVAVVPVCGQCQRQHAAIETCGAVV
jgi:hypothetical protein